MNESSARAGCEAKHCTSGQLLEAPRRACPIAYRLTSQIPSLRKRCRTGLTLTGWRALLWVGTRSLKWLQRLDLYSCLLLFTNKIKKGELWGAVLMGPKDGAWLCTRLAARRMGRSLFERAWVPRMLLLAVAYEHLPRGSWGLAHCFCLAAAYEHLPCDSWGLAHYNIFKWVGEVPRESEDCSRFLNKPLKEEFVSCVFPHWSR